MKHHHSPLSLWERVRVRVREPVCCSIPPHPCPLPEGEGV